MQLRGGGSPTISDFSFFSREQQCQSGVGGEVGTSEPGGVAAAGLPWTGEIRGSTRRFIISSKREVQQNDKQMSFLAPCKETEVRGLALTVKKSR